MRTFVLACVVFGLVRPAVAQPVAAAAEASVLGSLVAELERHNPELAAAAREVDMRVARIAPAGAPPDPVLNVGYMSGFLRAPFFPSSTTPDAFRAIGITQELPYPGKLTLRSRVAATEADAARWSYEDVRARLIAELKSSYVEYVLVTRTLQIVHRNKSVLEHIRDVAEIRFAVGKASQQDLLRAQLELSILLERIVSLERDLATTEAEINRLLDRSPGTPVPVGHVVEAQPVPESVVVLQAQAAQSYPALKRDEQQVNRGQQALALARRDRLPDFGVRFTTQKGVGGMPWMYGVDFMVQVPIFWQRRQQPMVAEAAAALQGATRMREGTLAEAGARVAQEFAAIATSRRLVELYSDSVLPQARLVLESATTAYEVGSVDFLTVLTNVITVLTYEIALEEQRARQFQASARLEPLVGIEFIR
jgi:outer membrane protein TolC